MNLTNGRVDSEHTDLRGAPPMAAPEGADAFKLQAAKDAAKKRLLRMVVQQAAEELGDADQIVELAFREGLFSDDLISGLREKVRRSMTHRLIEHISESGEDGLAAEAAEALADAPEVKSAVDTVQRRLSGAIAKKALARMEDEEALAESIYEQIAKVNDETIIALSNDVRSLVVQSIADRAWAASVDPDEILKMAESRIDPEDPAIAAAVERITEQASAIAVRRATETASWRIVELVSEQVTEESLAEAARAAVMVDESTIRRVADKIRDAAVETVRNRVEESMAASHLADEIAQGAVGRVTTSVEDRVTHLIRESGIERDVAEQAADDVSRRIALSVLQSDELMRRVEARIGDNDARMHEVAERARTEFAVQLTDDLIAAVTADKAIDLLTAQAIADVRLRVAQDVAIQVAAIPAPDLARESAALLEPGDLVLVGDALKLDLARLVAGQIVGSASAMASVTEEAVRLVPADSPFITQATTELKGNLTQQIAARAVADLEQNGIPTDDPRITAAAQSVHTLVTGFLNNYAMKVATTSTERERVAQDVACELHDLIISDTIEAFASRDAADLAATARERMPDSALFIANAAEQLGDRMAEEIARRAETDLRAAGIDLDHPNVAATMVSMQSAVREMLAERVYEAVSESDTCAQVTAEVTSRVHDAVTSDTVKAIQSRNPAEMAHTIAAQIRDDEPVIRKATESVLASLRANIARTVTTRIESKQDVEAIASSIVEAGPESLAAFIDDLTGTLREYAKDRAIEEVGSTESVAELARTGYSILRDRLVVKVAQDTASADATELAAEAASLMGEAPAIAEDAANLLHARLVESIAARATDQLGSVAAASEKARVVAESEKDLVEDAILMLHDVLAGRVAEEVTHRIRQTGQLAQAAASFVDPDDPAVESAATDVANDLGRLVAVRAVDHLSSEENRRRIVDEAQAACSDQMDDSVRETEGRMMQTIVSRITDRFADAGDTARRAQEKLGADHAPIIAAAEVLKELVLEDLSRKATMMLLDASQTADRAFSRINLDDPRFSRAQDALRGKIVDAVAERALQALEDVDASAGMVRALIPEDHETLVGTTALVRDMLLDDIASRSEASLSDTRAVARMSRQRVPEDSVNLATAGEALRDLLIDDLVRMTTKAFEDATETAETAMSRVDTDDDVLQRARAVFKERILMSVLGEAIRDIGGSFGSGRADAQQAVFQQAMTAMARQSGHFGPPAEDRSPAEPVYAPRTPSTGPFVPFVPAPEISGTSFGAQYASATPSVSPRTAPRTAPQTDAPFVLPDESWVRLSDFDDSDAAPAAPVSKGPRPTERPLDVIVTEFVDVEPFADDDAEMESGDDAFSFAWVVEDGPDGESTPEFVHGSGDRTSFSAIDRESSGDGASSGRRSSVKPAWDEATRAYVYGFVPDDGSGLPVGVDISAMDPAFTVRFVTVRGIRAIMSPVPADEFDHGALARRSSDTGWLRNRIRTHARVLDAFKGFATVIPLRFGSVFANDADVAVMMEGRHARITELLERLAGRMEWGVRAVRNVDRMRARLVQSGRSVEDSVSSLSTGVAAFVREELSKSPDLEDEALMSTVTQHCLTRADEALRRWAENGTEKSMVRGPGTDVVMNRAYLVAQSAVSDFRAELKKLGAEFEAIGISFDMTGPWPPFHFSGFDDDHSAGAVSAIA